VCAATTATLAPTPDFGVVLARLWLVLQSSWTMGDMKYRFLALLHPSSAYAILHSQPSG
jgi:hypothetical protein